ncbi:MAG: helix-turn-helix domain-containing protein, partial [Acidobacteriota bacterium]
RGTAETPRFEAGNFAIRSAPMELKSESLRLILGLKLRQFRLDQAWGLKDVSSRTGLSVSYLSEIEKGRKYPKPEKLIKIAQGLGLTYEELVSPRVEENLHLVRDLFASPFLQEFPFHLFGIEAEQVAALVTEAPSKAGALLRTFLEIGRSYDVQVEHFLFAALRSYQAMERNYFPEIERAAENFLAENGWADRRGLEADDLRRVLEERHGYRIESSLLESYSELSDLRSVLVDGDRPVLLINKHLRPPQRAFALARELGYRALGHTVRSKTSGYLRVESFDQVINDFEAAYFSGAVLLPKSLLVDDLNAFFAAKTWDAEAFVGFLERYRTTPETFFYRLSQLLPAVFGFEQAFFARFSHDAALGVERFDLTKLLNMSGLPIPLNIQPGERYCRRWPGLWLLDEPTRAVASSENSGFKVAAAAQRGRFKDFETEHLTFSLTRPLSIAKTKGTSVSVSFRIDGALREKVAFWNDPAIPERDVGVTCERCSFVDCEERAADPTQIRSEANREKRMRALRTLVAQVRSGS